MAKSPSKLIHLAYRSAWIASTWALLMSTGCDEDHKSRSKDPHPTVASVRSPAKSSRGRSRAKSPGPTTPRSSFSASAARSASPATSAGAFGALGPERDFGPAVPAVLGKGIAVVRDKKDGLILSRRGDDGFERIDREAGEISRWPVALSPGPPSRAYWVSRNRLVRREIQNDGTPGPLEVLASGAANAAVAVARSEGPVERDVVLYIGRRVNSEGTRSARVWVEGQRSRPISREAGGATSVSVIHLGGGRFALLTLDGRVGMSPVHAVPLELDEKGVPHLGTDRVVHVAGPAQRHTAITGVKLGRGPLALLPISKDARSFGLLMLRIGYGDGEAPASWLNYPNGLDPAPIAAGWVCGEPAIAFVRPKSDKPGSSHVLELCRVDPKFAIQARRQVASSASISHVDLSGGPGGGWLVYVTKDGLRSRRIECK